MTNVERSRGFWPQSGVIEELIEERVRVECNILEIDGSTWALHGGIGIDSDVILAEFGNRVDAEIALQQISAGENRTGGAVRGAVRS